jgi:taurine dioxygenase
MTISSSFNVRPVSAVGAGEITGLNCAVPFDADTLRTVRSHWGRYPILVFRDQPLTVPQLISFTKQFGELEYSDRSNYTHPEDEAVLILSNELGPDGKPIGVVDAGDFLHSDMQFSEAPVNATILQSIRRPSTGGDTEFCDMYAVHDALPADVRRRVAGRLAVNHVSKLRNKRVAVSTGRPDAKEYYASTESRIPDMAHPVIRTHPETGRQAVYVSPRFSLAIEGIEERESDELLDAIFTVMADKRHHYVHRWADHDLVMWDNRCLAHRATGGYVYPDIRRLHRTQIQGEKPYYRP